MKFLTAIFLILIMTSCRFVYRTLGIEYAYTTNPSLREIVNLQREDFAKSGTDTFICFRTVYGNCFGGSVAGMAKFISIKNGIESCQIFRKEPSERKIKSVTQDYCNLIAIIEYFEKNNLKQTAPIIASSFFEPPSYIYVDLKLGQTNYSDSIEYSAFYSTNDTLNPRYKFIKVVLDSN